MRAPMLVFEEKEYPSGTDSSLRFPRVVGRVFFLGGEGGEESIYCRLVLLDIIFYFIFNL